MKNILSQKAFTVSMAIQDYVMEVDYVGIVSANKDLNKLVKASFHIIKSEIVNAPIIEELPLTLKIMMRNQK